MSLLYLGMDGEMTDSELQLGAKLIEVGACTANINDLFVSRIAWPEEELMQQWTARAAAVHNIAPQDLILENKINPPVSEVDAALADWITSKDGRPERHSKFVVMIGWNVGTFDLPFFKAQLTETAQYLSRRTVDLNAVCYTMNDSVKWNGGYPTHKAWKRLGKEYAEITLRQNKVWTEAHNAGYDAQEAMLCWQFYRMAMRGEAPVDFTKM